MHEGSFLPIQLLFVTISIGALSMYRFIFPKKKILLFVLLISISLFPLISILRLGTYQSGDLTIHITRALSFYQSLSEGILIPHWAEHLNANFGYPLFLFIYPLPYYCVAAFHSIGLSFLFSVKLYLIVCYILSGIAIFLWAKEELSEFGAFATSVLYLYAPYHLVDLHFRVDVGELTSFAVFPFCLFFLKKTVHENTWFGPIGLSLCISLLIISHPAISLIGSIFLCAYAVYLWFLHTKRDGLQLVKTFFYFALGIFLSGWYVIPAVLESKFTHQAYETKITFQYIWEFFYSPWRFGMLYQGHEGELSFLFGYIHISLLIVAILFLFQKKFIKTEKKLVIFLFACFCVVFFFLQKFSEPFWYAIPLIKNFQFSYRLLFFVVFFLSTIGGEVLSKIKNRNVSSGILILSIGITILNWGNRMTLPNVADKQILANLPSATAQGEGLLAASPVWTDSKTVWESIPPHNHSTIISGTATIREKKRTSIVHEYSITATTPVVLQENTLYFPGWKSFVDNKEVPIGILKKSSKGVMIIRIPKGVHDIIFRFTSTPEVKLGYVVSIISLGVLLISAIVLQKGKFKI